LASIILGGDHASARLRKLNGLIGRSAKDPRLDLSGLQPYNDPRSGMASESMEKQSMTKTVAMRNHRLEARVTRDQKRLLQRAAELQGRTLTDFVIASAHEAAVKAIQDMEIIRLTVSESRAFAKALVNPTAPSRRLKAAAGRYVKALGR
jgi:uncharacterized protein (DUF1778 family)